MSRVAVWLCLSAAGLGYWGVVHDFAAASIHHFAGPVWFGGMALLTHWVINRAAPTSPQGVKEGE